MLKQNCCEKKQKFLAYPDKLKNLKRDEVQCHSKNGLQNSIQSACLSV